MQLAMLAHDNDNPTIDGLTDIPSLVRAAVDLGATSAGGPLSPAERSVVEEAGGAPSLPETILELIARAIREGDDPLGDALCTMRPVEARRPVGAFYTPASIIAPMVDWVLGHAPDRIVDAGCGSGRFVTSVARRAPGLSLIAVDNDPVATLLTRANLAVAGAGNASVLTADFTTVALPSVGGRTAFVGNPPYVRHHQLTPKAKAWALEAARRLGHKASGLAGLHAHFFLATALHAREGDVGCYVTSAEWLDVGYGSIIRDLLRNGLGGQSLHLVAPEARSFDDAQATAAIACFMVGQSLPELRVVRHTSFRGGIELTGGQVVPRQALESSERWSKLLLPVTADAGTRLGALARVHRGIVTGGNGFFVMTKSRARELGLERWCSPAITGGDEIIESGGVLRDAPGRKVLLDVPAGIDRGRHPRLDEYLAFGERAGGKKGPVAEGYVCSHRRPWWALGKLSRPPIVASYMARQALAFAVNPDGLVLLNIGHGLYPRTFMSAGEMTALVHYLNEHRARFRGEGRTYQGGLEKFEPREMEALTVDWPPDAG